LDNSWGASSTAGAHAQAQIDQVVIHAQEEWVDTVGASGILARSIALPDDTVWLLPFFVASVIEVEWPGRSGVVRDHVLVVYDTVLVGELCVGVLCVVGLSNSWLAKVDHGHWVARVNQLHSSELSESSSQTVASGLDSIGGIKSSQTLNLLKNIWIDSLGGGVETRVNLTISTIWESGVIHLVNGEVSNPVSDWFRAPEYNVDWVVRGKVANESLNIVNQVGDYLCGNKTCNDTRVMLGFIDVFAAVSILTKLERDSSLSISVAVWLLGKWAWDEHASCEHQLRLHSKFILTSTQYLLATYSDFNH